MCFLLLHFLGRILIKWKWTPVGGEEQIDDYIKVHIYTLLGVGLYLVRLGPIVFLCLTVTELKLVLQDRNLPFTHSNISCLLSKTTALMSSNPLVFIFFRLARYCFRSCLVILPYCNGSCFYFLLSLLIPFLCFAEKKWE